MLRNHQMTRLYDKYEAAERLHITLLKKYNRNPTEKLFEECDAAALQADAALAEYRKYLVNVIGLNGESKFVKSLGSKK